MMKNINLNNLTKSESNRTKNQVKILLQSW